MAPADSPDRLQVEVVYSPRPREVERVSLSLPAGSVLADALRASGLVSRHGWVLDEQFSAGIWMKPRPLDTPLREADRVEVYRGLLVDPKEARRQRYQQHKESIAKRRPPVPKP